MSAPSRRAFLATPLASLLLPRATAAQGPDWPQRPIRVIVPFAAGGGTDLIARWLAERLRPAFTQPIVVENRTGANGIIAAQAALSAPADGHTILSVTSSTLLINPVIHASPGFDSLRDLQPLLQFGTSATVLSIRPDRGLDSLAALLAEAKRRPGALSYATFGVGSISHIFGSMLERVAGVQLSHVPYRGSAPAVQDVVAGNVTFSLNDEAATLPQINAGNLIALAVAGRMRSEVLPNAPTFLELGYGGGLELLGFQGMAMRTGTPPAIVQRFADAALAVLQTPEGRANVRQLGIAPTLLAPADFAAQLRTDAPVWAQASRDSGARVD